MSYGFRIIILKYTLNNVGKWGKNDLSCNIKNKLTILS